MNRNYKKIDIYLKNLKGFYAYECSTNAYPTCRQAKASMLKRHGLDDSQVKCNFAKA